MLKPFEIEHIRELAAKGLSQRLIARRTGHGRKQVARVLEGQNAGPGDATTEAKSCSIDGPSVVSFKINYVRCKECGRLVQNPCLACRIARLKSRRPLPRAA